MSMLYTFWDHVTYYKTESVHFWGLMNSATKRDLLALLLEGVLMVNTPKEVVVESLSMVGLVTRDAGAIMCIRV